MGLESKEASVTPERYAALALGVVAFQAGFGHGSSLHTGGTPAGRVILDQDKADDIWTSVYVIALQSHLANGYDGMVVAIGNEFGDLLSDNGRRAQIRNDFILSDSSKVVSAYAVDLAAHWLGMLAFGIGQRLGVVGSAWIPEASYWVEVFETAKEAAMSQMTKHEFKVETSLMRMEELPLAAIVEAASAGARALSPVIDRTKVEESKDTRQIRPGLNPSPELATKARAFPDASRQEGAFGMDTSARHVPPSFAVLVIGTFTVLIGTLFAVLALFGVVAGGGFYFVYGGAMVWGILMMAGSLGRP